MEELERDGWNQEHLPPPQAGHQWNQEKNQEERRLLPGDLVMVVDSSAPPGWWMLGTVMGTFQGLVRVVPLKTQTSPDGPGTNICFLNQVQHPEPPKELLVWLYVCIPAAVLGRLVSLGNPSSSKEGAPLFMCGWMQETESGESSLLADS